MAYIGGLVFIVPCVVMSYLMIRILGSNPVHPIMTPLLEGNRWQVLGFYGIACILAPVTEETMFRGILFHHLRNRWSWLSTAIIVSFIFAVLHPQGWAAVPALGGIAIVLTGIREWRGSLIAPVAAHALNNFLALTFALLLLR
jgi:membrane protease YdiL (CAAX protease family)